MNMNVSMETIVVKKLTQLIFSCVLLMCFFIFHFTKIDALQNFKNTSEIQIAQISQILSTNSNNLSELKDITHEDYLSKARAVALLVESNPGIVDSYKDLKHIATLMQIDQIHVFDEKGVIIAGTIPEYVGASVDDGAQIGYFKAILVNSSIELVQNISPTTVDGVLMQYTGVARKDKKGIVQIGIKPQRMVETLKQNEISYVLSMLIHGKDESIFLFDKKTGFIQGSTNYEYDFKNLYDLGFNKIIIQKSVLGEFIEMESELYYSVLSESKNGMIGITIDKNSMDIAVIERVILIALCMSLISIFMIFMIKRLLEIYVIRGIKKIIVSLKKITSGNLETQIMVNNNLEFNELSYHINMVVGYLLQSTSKISRIIEAVDINIAIYEYGNNSNSVITTNRLADILGFSNKDAEILLADKDLFEKRIVNICQDVEDGMTYAINLPEGNRHIKIKTFHDVNSTMGIVFDVTDDVLRRNEIIHERDYDILTGLYNRRALTYKTDKLFADPSNLKVTCVMMIDMDNLKKLNDTHGHYMGDNYIKAGVDIICIAEDRDHCFIARLGGDEFVVIFYGYDDQEIIIEKINEINEKMLKSFIYIDEIETYPVRFSAGYVFYSPEAQDISMLLSKSDMAMYASKKNARHKFIHYEAHMQPR